MVKSISVLDKNYLQWVRELGERFRQSQIKAAIRVNQTLLEYYWWLGHDIFERQYANSYGAGFYASLSRDLQHALPGVKGLSERNILYAYQFYSLYCQSIKITPQVVAQSDITLEQLCSIPWGHHRYIMDKCADNVEKALFYVSKTLEEGWSRSVLLSFLKTDLFERSKHALTNFNRTLPATNSDLARELVKDPYNFSFTQLQEPYNEAKLKDALLTNITRFLLELGTGFSYVGREYLLRIGQKEKYVDLLFYHLKLSCYVVVEVKIGEFDFEDMGQLAGYVVACNHLIRKDGRDNPTIGLLICKQKDNLLAQYALEASNQPLGISEYELAKLYPKEIEGAIPSVEEIETKVDV